MKAPSGLKAALPFLFSRPSGPGIPIIEVRNPLRGDVSLNLSPLWPLSTGSCSNGISGVESDNGKYCCPPGCAACAGSDCGSFGTDCCASDIEDLCSSTRQAPCEIDDGESRYIVFLRRSATYEQGLSRLNFPQSLIIILSCLVTIPQFLSR